MEETSFQFICPMSPTVRDCATFPPLVAEKNNSQPANTKNGHLSGRLSWLSWLEAEVKSENVNPTTTMVLVA